MNVERTSPASVPPSQAAAEGLLDLQAAARYLGLSPRSVVNLIYRGQLKPVRLCRRLLFDPRDLSALIEKSKGGQP